MTVQDLVAEEDRKQRRVGTQIAHLTCDDAVVVVVDYIQDGLPGDSPTRQRRLLYHGSEASGSVILQSGLPLPKDA